MFNKFLSFIAILSIGALWLNVDAQSLQDLQNELDATKTSISDLEKKQIDLEKAIDGFDVIGWKMGGAGGLGFNLAGFSDSWVVGKGDNVATLLGNLSLFANYNQEKYFWNNTGLLRLGYINSVPSLADNALFDNWTRNQDEIYISSLFGYKLTETFAISALADARTSFGGFFDPGYISVGVGGTWKPSANFVLVVHPLTFRGTFAQDTLVKQGFGFDDLNSNIQGDFGAKILASYTRELAPRLTWASNLNVFFNYGDFENPEATWNNDFGYALSPQVSLAFGHAFRFYKPETYGQFRKGFPLASAGQTNEQLESLEQFGGDAFKFGQQKWLFTVGITTTFDITKIPLLGDVNDN